MARLARVVAPGIPHHVTQRGNRQQTVFFADTDRQVYLDLLAKHSMKHDLWIEAFCLMPNHVHLVVVPECEDSMAKGLGRTHNDHARWLHVRMQLTGHLWQNRFFSCPLEEDHYWEALRYVELNPVRGGLAQHPWDWAWSSARAHLAGADPTGLLDLAEWSTQYNPQRWKEALELGLWEAAFEERIREANRAGRPLGGEEFVERLERDLGRPLRDGKPGRRPKVYVPSVQMKLGIA